MRILLKRLPRSLWSLSRIDRHSQLFAITLIMLLFTTGRLMADAITFEATVNSPKVTMNEALQLTLTFTGVNQNLDPISLPTINGFATRYLGPSTSVSIVNGNYHSEKSFMYNLFP